jgi:hypothetical protein
LRVLFKDILVDLDKKKYKDLNMPILEARHLIIEIRDFLKDKRYVVYILMFSLIAFAIVISCLQAYMFDFFILVNILQNTF